MKTRDSASTHDPGILRRGILFIAVVIFFAGNAKAQMFSAYGGLGVEYYKADGLSNYLNYAAPGSMNPGSYTSAIRFILGGEYDVTKNWAIGIEYGYITKSITGSNAISSQQVSFSYSLPSLTIRRLIRGNGYSFRFGGAFGYHFGSLSTSSPYSNRSIDYSAKGFGMQLDGSLDTKLDPKLYARVAVNARAEFVGDLKAADGTKLTYIDYNSQNTLPVNMHMIGVGLSFGLVYYF